MSGLDLSAATSPPSGGVPGVSEEEVREWLAGSVDPGPGPADDPAHLAERIHGLKAAAALKRLVDLQDGGNGLVPGWVDQWHDAWVEAHELVKEISDV